jgi:hypothetical protein
MNLIENLNNVHVRKIIDALDHELKPKSPLESNLNRTYIRGLLSRELDAYSDKLINKSGGRTRQISVPEHKLALIQNIVLKRIESLVYGQDDSNVSSVSTNAHAYIKGRSHLTSARTHLGMTWGVKVDISAFFDNVTQSQVRAALERIGFTLTESMIYAALCTRQHHNWQGTAAPKFRRFKRTIRSEVSSSKEFDSPELSGIEQYSTFLTRGNWSRRRLKRRHEILGHPILDDSSLILPPKRFPRLLANSQRQRHFDSNKELDSPRSGQVHRSSVDERFIRIRTEFFTFLSELQKRRNLIQPRLGRENHLSPDPIRVVAKEGNLPQGAATSGLLANLVLFDFDNRLSGFATSNGYTFSRYSDDIVLGSLDNNFNKDKALQAISFVQQVAELHGFTLNKNKTRIMTPGSRKFVLGVLVDNPECTRLSRYDRERIEKMIWQLSKTSIEEYVDPAGMHVLNETHFLPGKRVGSKLNPNTPSQPVDSLFGWLAYCKAADLAFLIRVNQQLVEGKWDFKDKAIESAILQQTAQLLKKDLNSGSIESPISSPNQNQYSWNLASHLLDVPNRTGN